MNLNSFTHQECTDFIATYHVNHIYLKHTVHMLHVIEFYRIVFISEYVGIIIVV